jgi:hypothetical protein
MEMEIDRLNILLAGTQSDRDCLRAELAEARAGWNAAKDTRTRLLEDVEKLQHEAGVYRAALEEIAKSDPHGKRDMLCASCLRGPALGHDDRCLFTVCRRALGRTDAATCPRCQQPWEAHDPIIGAERPGLASTVCPGRTDGEAP